MRRDEATRASAPRQPRGPALLIRFDGEGLPVLFVEAHDLAEQREMQRLGDALLRIVEVLRDGTR